MTQQSTLLRKWKITHHPCRLLPVLHSGQHHAWHDSARMDALENIVPFLFYSFVRKNQRGHIRQHHHPRKDVNGWPIRHTQNKNVGDGRAQRHQLKFCGSSGHIAEGFG